MSKRGPFPEYTDVSTAPYVYFDGVVAFGNMGPVVQIEVASRILISDTSAAVEKKFVTTGRLRCSAAAAVHLRDAINSALALLEQPQQEDQSAPTAPRFN
jgi:hypothetical protein